MGWADNAVDATALSGSTDSDHKFIPEIWKDEVIAARENNLTHAKLFRRLSHVGKKGDILHLPTISNLAATTKGEHTAVTLVASSESDNQIPLDTHKEVSMLYEDFGGVQESYAIRGEYTKKAGYALGKVIDSSVHALIESISNSSPDHWIEGDGTDANKSAPAVVALTKAGVITAIKLLDKADVPGNPGQRFLIIMPDAKASLLAIDDFTIYSEFGVRPTPLVTGVWGQIMGVEVYMTNNYHNTTTNTIGCCVMGHEDAIVSAIQLDVRVQAQYMLDYLGTLVVSDVIYGVQILRDDHAVCITTGPDNT